MSVPEVDKPDLSDYLERRKAELRARHSVRPLLPEEKERLEDMDWALLDPDVNADYVGEWVVPYKRRIVAHGHDLAAVLAEAVRLTGRKREELPILGIDDPLQDISG